VEPPPRNNRLLAALPADDYRRLLPQLEPVALPAGSRLHSAGRPEPYLYFPTEGTVARVCTTADGQCAEFALTGREGAVGVAAFLSGTGMATEARVVGAGHAYRLRAEAVLREFERGGALPDLLIRYTGDLIAHAGQSAVCGRFHTLEQRLCSWILSHLDRGASNEVAASQELLAEMLGVRREAVTRVAGALRREKLIRSSRSRIVVLDRAGLRARACECYAALRRTSAGPAKA
jgi:CRP-like cAMP-binding protein